MKHTGGETTTSVGRYDTSLGDFRLGEDYDELYPLADFRKIPLLLDKLCRTTDVQLTEAGVSENIKIVATTATLYCPLLPTCRQKHGVARQKRAREQ